MDSAATSPARSKPVRVNRGTLTAQQAKQMTIITWVSKSPNLRGVCVGILNLPNYVYQQRHDCVIWMDVWCTKNSKISEFVLTQIVLFQSA